MAAGQSHHATPPMTSATDGGRGDDDPATPQRPRGQSRARQSGEPFGAHRIGAHRPCDVLDAVLADVVEGVRKLVPDLVSDHSGDANSTGLGECLQPCRDIHTVAEDVVFFDDHIAQIDPNAEPDATLLAHLRFAADHPALNLHSAAHGIHNTRKLRQKAVAGVLYGAASVLLDLRIDKLPQMRLEAFVRALLVRAHQPRIPRDIGGQYCGETARLAHSASPAAKRRPDRKSSRCSGPRR